MKLNYGATLTKKEKEKLSEVIEERDLLKVVFSQTMKACKSTGDTICKILEEYEDPATSEEEKSMALWAIRGLAKELIELGENGEV